MPTPIETTWLQRFVTAFKANPSRSTIVTFLVAMLIVAWGRVLLGGHGGPSTAHGATNMSGATASSPLTLDSLQKISEEDNSSLQRWANGAAKPLNRNPFTIPLDFYPHDGVSDAGDTTSAGYWDLVKKSMSSRADQQEQRQIILDNVRIAAEQLKLESTILGETPLAMINGEIVHEGSVVAGFHVLKIEARQIVVEREGVKLALLME
jgi:hypothetical protein